MIRKWNGRTVPVTFSIRAFATAFCHTSAIVVAATLVACAVSDSPTDPLKPKMNPRFTEDWNAEMSVNVGGFEDGDSLSVGDSLSTNSIEGDPYACPVYGEDYEIEGTMVFPAAPPAGQQSVPVWEGQNFAFADVADAEGAFSRCYDIIDNFKFSKIIDGNIEVFHVPVAAHKIQELGEMGSFAAARYQMPLMFIVSQSGRAQTFGGTVDLLCVEANYQLRLPTSGLYVSVVAYRSFRSNTSISRLSDPNGGGGKPTGWLYYEPGRGIASANSGGWEGALDEFLAFGTCTQEWDVWVDGNQVCKDGERVSMT